MLNPNLVNRKYRKRVRHQCAKTLLPKTTSARFAAEHNSRFPAAAVRVEALKSAYTDGLLAGFCNDH
jgi:hypothetical protein